MNEDGQAVLVDRCCHGDEDAFRALMQQYRTTLYGTAYLMMRDHGLAEDVLQEALMQIWRHLPSYKFRGNLKAWLIRIVINEAKQQFRKKRIRMGSLEETGSLADCEGSIEPYDDRALLRDELRRAVDDLPAEQREVVVLRFFSELTVPEIASALGRREGTVKSRLNRALGRLRLSLSGAGLHPGA